MVSVIAGPADVKGADVTGCMRLHPPAGSGRSPDRYEGPG
jgi:hypothetical protein